MNKHGINNTAFKTDEMMVKEKDYRDKPVVCETDMKGDATKICESRLNEDTVSKQGADNKAFRAVEVLDKTQECEDKCWPGLYQADWKGDDSRLCNTATAADLFVIHIGDEVNAKASVSSVGKTSSTLVQNLSSEAQASDCLDSKVSLQQVRKGESKFLARCGFVFQNIDMTRIVAFSR